MVPHVFFSAQCFLPVSENVRPPSPKGLQSPRRKSLRVHFFRYICGAATAQRKNSVSCILVECAFMFGDTTVARGRTMLSAFDKLVPLLCGSSRRPIILSLLQGLQVTPFGTSKWKNKSRKKVAIITVSATREATRAAGVRYASELRLRAAERHACV